MSPDTQSARLIVVDGKPVLSIAVRDLPDVIGVSRTTVYRLIEAGELRPFHIGTTPLVRTEDVVALIDRLAAEDSDKAAPAALRALRGRAS